MCYDVCSPRNDKIKQLASGVFESLTTTLLCTCVSAVRDTYGRVGAFVSRHHFMRRVRRHAVVEIFLPPVKTIRNPSLNHMGWRVFFKYLRGGSYCRLKRYVLFSLSSEPESISVPRVIVHAFQSLGFCLISVIQVSNSFNFILSFKLIYMQFACQSFFF